MALAARLEEEYHENRMSEIKLVLQGLGVKFDSKEKKTPIKRVKKDASDLPLLSSVMTELMGKGGVVIE
jgi:hypothetical protein